MAIIKKSSKSEKPKDTLTLCSSEVPEVLDWPIGGEYEVIVKVKMTGANEVDNWEVKEYGYKKGDVKARFDIVEVKSAVPSKKGKGMYVTQKKE